MSATTSFPELFLLLRRHNEQKRGTMRLQAISQLLAAKAVWDDKASKAANEFIESLDDSSAPPPEDNAKALIRMFAGFGIPITEE